MVEDLDRKLLKTAIKYLLEGYTLEIGNIKLRYYRKNDIIESEEWDQQALENGIFQEFLMNDRSGMFTNWMKMVELDQVDYFYNKMSDTEKEELYISICASMVLSKSKRK